MHSRTGRYFQALTVAGTLSAGHGKRSAHQATLNSTARTQIKNKQVTSSVTLHTLRDSPDEVAVLYLLLPHTRSKNTPPPLPSPGRPPGASPGPPPGPASPAQPLAAPASGPPASCGQAAAPPAPLRFSTGTSAQADTRTPPTAATAARSSEGGRATGYHLPPPPPAEHRCGPNRLRLACPTPGTRQPPRPPHTPRAGPGRSSPAPPPKPPAARRRPYPGPGSPWYCRSKRTSRRGSAEPRRPAEAAGDTISAAPVRDARGDSPGRGLQLLRGGSWAPLIGRARPPAPSAERRRGVGLHVRCRHGACAKGRGFSRTPSPHPSRACAGRRGDGGAHSRVPSQEMAAGQGAEPEGAHPPLYLYVVSFRLPLLTAARLLRG